MKPNFKQMVLSDDENNHKIVFDADGGCTLTPLQVMAVQQLLRRIDGLNGALHSSLNLSSENDKLKEGVKKILLSQMEDVTKYSELLSELFDPDVS